MRIKEFVLFLVISTINLIKFRFLNKINTSNNLRLKNIIKRGNKFVNNCLNIERESQTLRTKFL